MTKTIYKKIDELPTYTGVPCTLRQEDVIAVIDRINKNFPLNREALFIMGTNKSDLPNEHPDTKALKEVCKWFIESFGIEKGFRRIVPAKDRGNKK